MMLPTSRWWEVVPLLFNSQGRMGGGGFQGCSLPTPLINHGLPTTLFGFIQCYTKIKHSMGVSCLGTFSIIFIA